MTARSVPEHLRSLPHTALVVEAVVILASFAVLSAASTLADDYWLQIGFRILIYLALAEAWNLMAGFAGLVSLGTSTFVGLGAYVAFGLLNHSSVPLPIVLAGSALAGAALSTLVAPALFRLRGLYFTVGTLALAELLRLAMINISAFGGASGIFLQSDPPPLPELFRYALFAALLASLVIWGCGRFATMRTLPRRSACGLSGSSWRHSRSPARSPPLPAESRRPSSAPSSLMECSACSGRSTCSPW
jgi:ABC-type branched-subunit amino acid transport system permease subunit